MFVKDHGTCLWLHALMLLGGLTILVWMLGDRWWIGAGQHVLNDDGPHMQVGAHTAGLVPRAAIRRCLPLTESVAAWCRHGIDARHTSSASPLDKPNLVLVLDPTHPPRLRHLGRERDGLACVFLYLDRPGELIGELGGELR